MDVYSKYQAGNGAVNLRHPPCIAVGEIIRIRTEGSVPEKAFLGADLSRGAVRVHGSKEPGMSQALAAVLADSTPSNVCVALKRMYVRKAILDGFLPLRPTYPWVGEADIELLPPEAVEEVEEAVIPECHKPLPTYLQEVEQTEQVVLKTPSEKFLTRLAQLVGVDAWLRAGVAADL
jgi:hypothetical protein